MAGGLHYSPRLRPVAAGWNRGSHDRSSDPECNPPLWSDDLPGLHDPLKASVPVLPVDAASSRVLPSGKLAPGRLARVLNLLPASDPTLLVGPGQGEDAAVLAWPDCSSELLVATCDPITFTTDDIGLYALTVGLNDLAVCGAEPRWFLPVVLLPAGQATVPETEHMFQQLGEACTAAGISVVGGHTEVTDAVRRTVISGTMIGTVDRRHLVATAGAQPGDVLLLAGWCPVEAVSILARTMHGPLLAQGWTTAELNDVSQCLYEPGISIREPALAAARSGLATAMHDPTEGGVATAMRELAAASNTGLEVDLDRIPVPAFAARICRDCGLDPLGCIASGSLLCTCRPGDADTLQDAWRDLGWPSVQVGRVTTPEAGLAAQHRGRLVPLPQFAADELTRLPPA